MVELVVILSLFIILACGLYRGGMKDLAWFLSFILACMAVPIFADPVGRLLSASGILSVFPFPAFAMFFIYAVTFVLVGFVTRLLVGILLPSASGTLGKGLDGLLGVVLAILKIFVLIWLLEFLCKQPFIGELLGGVLSQSRTYLWLASHNPLEDVLALLPFK